jgi:hypothetical protein
MCSLGETGITTATQTRAHGAAALNFSLSTSQGIICEVLVPVGSITEVIASYSDGAYAGAPAITRNPPANGSGSVYYAGA